MRILVTEDDFTSRRVMTGYLARFGAVDVAVDGQEAVDAVRLALADGQPYRLICLDIMMPNLNGQDALTVIRELESEHGVLPGDGARVIMTTALSDPRNILRAFNAQAEAYLVKPVTREKLYKQLLDLGLVSAEQVQELSH